MSSPSERSRATNGTEPNNYVVLGASGGIGREVCQRLHDRGARLVLAGRNESALAELGHDLESPYRVVDAGSIEQVDGLMQEAAKLMTPLHGVVNCVGSVLLKPAHLTTAQDWEETLRTNLTSAFGTLRGAVKVMRKAGGSIVLISSAAAQIGLANHEAIAAAKAGIIGLVRSAAASYAASGIRVNGIAPGLVRTPLTEKIWSQERAAEASRSMHALGRLGEPADIASAICWLLEPENDWITGQIIGVDGGLATVRSLAQASRK